MLVTDYVIPPALITMLDFLPGVVMVILYPSDIFSLIFRRFRFIASLAVSTFLSALLHRNALAVTSVTTVNVIKASQPIFVALLSGLLLSDNTNRQQLISLMGIMLGILLATANRNSQIFHLSSDSFGYGAALALISTFFLALNSTINKKLRSVDRTDNNMLFAATRLIAFPLAVMSLPFNSPSVPVTKSLSKGQLLVIALVYIVVNLTQHLASLSVLFTLTPVEHSIIASFKRVLIITVASIYFGTPLSFVNSIGIAIASLAVLQFRTSDKPKIVPVELFEENLPLIASNSQI